jgi:hypothetical protein
MRGSTDRHTRPRPEKPLKPRGGFGFGRGLQVGYDLIEFAGQLGQSVEGECGFPELPEDAVRVVQELEKPSRFHDAGGKGGRTHGCGLSEGSCPRRSLVFHVTRRRFFSKEIRDRPSGAARKRLPDSFVPLLYSGGVRLFPAFKPVCRRKHAPRFFGQSHSSSEMTLMPLISAQSSWLVLAGSNLPTLCALQSCSNGVRSRSCW